MRGLRHRHGRAKGYRIGARGLENTATIHVTPGHIYSMGASSSPKAIRILSVTDDRIQYRSESQYGNQEPAVIERWIGEDLIARGEASFRQHYGVSTNEWYNMTPAQREPHVRKMMGRARRR